jgi:hypothetical protein
MFVKYLQYSIYFVPPLVAVKSAEYTAYHQIIMVCTACKFEFETKKDHDHKLIN